MSMRTENKEMPETIETLKRKAALFDALVELIEDQGLAYVMQEVEHEKNIPIG